jgi:hypothetical protein
MTNTTIQIGQLVEIEIVVEVEIMNIAGEAGAEGYRDLGLQELDHAVCITGQTADGAPLCDAPEEWLALACYEVPHKFTIQTGNN